MRFRPLAALLAVASGCTAAPRALPAPATSAPAGPPSTPTEPRARPSVSATIVATMIQARRVAGPDDPFFDLTRVIAILEVENPGAPRAALVSLSDLRLLDRRDPAQRRRLEGVMVERIERGEQTGPALAELRGPPFDGVLSAPVTRLRVEGHYRSSPISEPKLAISLLVDGQPLTIERDGVTWLPDR